VTRISDLLAVDFLELIQENIAVTRDHPDAVFLKPDGYIVTDHIGEEFERLFSSMAAGCQSPDERVGIWVSGPPGSGKSSFAKYLGAELFHRFSLYRIFPVNIRAQAAAEAHADFLCEAMYRAVLHELDYSQDYPISELEIMLEKQGELGAFEDLCRTLYGKEWREIRNTSEKLACASSLVHRLAPQTYASADQWLEATQGWPSRRLNARDLTEKVFELCALRRPGKALAFILDEIGSYATLGGERTENLRAILEQFGKQSLERWKAGKIPGPVWIAVVAQEKLPEVSKHLAASRTGHGRLEEYFRHQADLSTSDMREVITRRVLLKKEGQEPLLRKLFRERGASLLQNVKLEGWSRRTDFDEDEFVRSYPYLPHVIDISMEIIAGIRLHPDRPRPLDASDITIIRHCVDMFSQDRTRLYDQPVGGLVSIDMIYDLVEPEISLEKQKRIWEVQQRFDNSSYPGMASRVAKAICLMEFVTGDLPRTRNNIARLLIRNVSEEPATLAVARMLCALKEAQYIRPADGGWKLYDFDELRRRAAGLKDLRSAIGVVNPRLPGWYNDLIQAAKKMLARFLSWYTRPLFEFDTAVSRTLEEVVLAVDHLTSSLIALDHHSVKQALDYLPVSMVEIEEQLARMDKTCAPVAGPVKAHVARLHQQVKVLASMQNGVNPEGLDQSGGKVRYSAQRQRGDRTTYVIGLFGTGRRYVNQLLLENIGRRARYFRDGIRLHPGPTPMIYSGHVTIKYPSCAQESPAVMRSILRAVRSGFADSIFVYRHPLDSLLTNWVWWRTHIRDKRMISGISEVYRDTQDLCADLENNFGEFEKFASGDPDFFGASRGLRFLSFSEFVEESEIHIRSHPLTLRLEDFAVDPLKEFSKILEVMSVERDLGRLSLFAPRTRPYGYVAVREHVPLFRNFIEGLDAGTKKRIENIGYTLSGGY
jgi:hypothetical protein